MMRVLAALAAVLALLAPSAGADLPGTLAPAAAGDGHLWWVVEASEQALKDARAEDGRRFLLMHHPALAPAPTERLVTRLRMRPDALAAEGSSVYIVTPREGEIRRMVLSLRAERNTEVGHWYTLPREGPEILAPIERDGDLLGFTVAGGALHALMRVEGDAPGTRRLAMLVLPPAGAGRQDWTEAALPPIDLDAPVGLATAAGLVHLLAMKNGMPFLYRLEGGAWINAPGALGFGDARVAQPLGAIEVGRRAVLVERAADGRIALSHVRPDGVAPWASFEEPSGPWALGGLGPDAALLGLDERARGTVRLVAPSAAAPGEPIALAPPSFASGRWFHLPILGFLSVALVLAAVIFGSDSYLDPARLRRVRAQAEGVDPAPLRGAANEVEESRPIGASLSQRLLAFTVDLLPALVAGWLWLGGNPLDFLQVPVLVTDLETARGAMLVMGMGWAFSAAGDVLFGRSLGKRMAGLRIVSSSGGPARVGPRVVRAVASAIVVASPFVQLVALIHPRGLGPAEMLSGTCVIDDRATAADQIG